MTERTLNRKQIWILAAAVIGAALLPCFLPKTGEGSSGMALTEIHIDTESGNLPGDSGIFADLMIREPGPHGNFRDIRSRAEIRIRGNTSRRFPKKSYKLKIVDEAGEKTDLPIADLRSDDDWILNPMYSDTSKIREALALKLWDELNFCGQSAMGTRAVFTEVYINGDYRGLYFLEERVDRKQVGADKTDGILYKITANQRPQGDELRACTSPDECSGIELVYSGENAANIWNPAADYMDLLDRGLPDGTDFTDHGGMLFDLENVIDYGLWSMAVQARDGHFKNQFINCVPDKDGGYVLYRIPWDLNHTFGDLWAGDSPETNYLTWKIEDPEPDDLLKVYLDTGDKNFRQMLASRWKKLRENALDEDAVLDYAKELFAALGPAIERDSLRWPECGTGEGNSANIRDIEKYICESFAGIDAWITRNCT